VLQPITEQQADDVRDELNSHISNLDFFSK